MGLGREAPGLQTPIAKVDGPGTAASSQRHPNANKNSNLKQKCERMLVLIGLLCEMKSLLSTQHGTYCLKNEQCAKQLCFGRAPCLPPPCPSLEVQLTHEPFQSQKNFL